MSIPLLVLQMPQGSENPAFRRIRNPESLAAELREGDGIDPRLERRKNLSSRHKDKPNHAAVRLAGQIAKTIRGNVGDGPLADFDVVSVQPAKGNVFLVTLGPMTPELDYNESQILDQANARSGHLRSEIACSITRKKVPGLLFRVLPCPALSQDKLSEVTP
jgi:ribosome-binding factor A